MFYKNKKRFPISRTFKIKTYFNKNKYIIYKIKKNNEIMKYY